MHKYYIDPSKFNYGTYYRWEGEWNSAENAVAFSVVTGTRNDTKTRIESDSNTSSTPTKIKKLEGPYSWIIARNDDPETYIDLARSDACYLWIFSNNIDTLGCKMSQSNITDDITTYTYQFNDVETANLTVGTKDAYIQCVGRNGISDIFMDGSTLDTIYDDSVVPDVKVDWWNPQAVKVAFDKITSDLIQFSSDDYILPIKIEVVEPSVFISDVYSDEENTKLYISGTTTWKNQTILTFRLDPDNYVLERDIALHSWITYASGDIDNERTFNTALSLKKTELSIGSHEIVSSVKKNSDTGISAYSFLVSDVYVMPTPTPKIVRKLYTEEGESLPTPLPTITPEVSKTTLPTPYISNTNGTSYVVVEESNGQDSYPFADKTRTQTVTKSIPVASSTIQTIPLATTSILSAVGLSIVMLRRRK
jgi:hypothetical protein